MTPTCRDIAELLIDFVENALPIEERLSIQHHLCGCTPCMIYMTSYRQTIMMTHRLPEEPLPPEFEARLQEVLAQAMESEGITDR
jgi:hypothetical protein